MCTPKIFWKPTWNLKVPPLGKGETFTNHQFWVFSQLMFKSQTSPPKNPVEKTWTFWCSTEFHGICAFLGLAAISASNCGSNKTSNEFFGTPQTRWVNTIHDASMGLAWYIDLWKNHTNQPSIIHGWVMGKWFVHDLQAEVFWAPNWWMMEGILRPLIWRISHFSYIFRRVS